MDVVTLSLAKKYASKVAAGFSKVEVDGMNLKFTLNDGTTASLTVPKPDDWAVIADAVVDSEGGLTLSLAKGGQDMGDYYTKEEVDELIKQIYPILRIVSDK